MDEFNKLTKQHYKNKWIELPLDPPNIAVEATSDGTIVYVSWNGSTQTVGWELLTGTSKKHLTPLLCMRGDGFETKAKVNSFGPYFQVNAINSCGQIIGKSRIAHVCE